jgi:oligopeptide/dipeptide ABC transporter ATP-binding protein
MHFPSCCGEPRARNTCQVRALLTAIPVPDPGTAARASVLKGEVPSALNPPRGCCFHPGCVAALTHCSETEPPLQPAAGGHLVACHNPR